MESRAGLDLVQLEKLFKLMGQYQMAELQWETAEQNFHVRTQAAFVAQAAPHQGHSVMMAAPQSAAANVSSGSRPAVEASKTGPALDAKTGLPANQKQVLSPFVGTFYRSASPGSEAYVREGSVVKRGDTLCIIEAMKLMNEIEAEVAGKIVSIQVENGQPVEFGEPLFIVEI
ncbi:MAG: acetyl-CoA carboxylase biotin carboxyl carrier protein [Methylotenera sp.]|nr:acetyl-CoA carboxylase biotin carboxyl carrier protein [Oligoflexia bacterium]